MNKIIKIALTTSLLVGAVATTQACSLGAWDGNGTTSLAGGPGDANDFARYQGLCAMQTAGATPTVLNNGIGGATSGPSGEATMVARFYFLPGAASGDIFTTYEEDSPSTAVYTVSYSSPNVTVTPNGGGAPVVVAVGGTNWHSVEISWVNNGGAINVWVDSDATIDAADASTTSEASADVINSAVLGGSAGMIFDAYESRRTTAVGRLLRGDANADGTVNIGDAVGVVAELNNVVTASGQPDCTEDGVINIGDAVCVVAILNN